MGECFLLSMIFVVNVSFEILVIAYLKDMWDTICNKNNKE